VKIFYVLQTEYIDVFRTDPKLTAIIFLHNINWLVLIMEAEVVSCAVRSRSSNTDQFNEVFK